ncbi:hypothetical protein J2T12_004768 [Paenibacillus anaericanus]|uniref:hypothetical protein n=1 Tax=Paenibacillus anaericanus TaxID=170367 RepID=UPI002786DA00|nr:hypothetical protein [Paenibacillus anaericanus]MDQ0091331.1 hypothetical protein [Paenibacillus anaericanus]
MNKLKKKHKIILAIILILALIIGALFIKSQIKNKQLFNKAVPIGTKFFKDYYGVDVTFNDYQMLGSYVLPHIVLYCFIKGVDEGKDNTISLNIDYDSFEVKRDGVPDWLMPIRNDFER